MHKRVNISGELFSYSCGGSDFFETEKMSAYTKRGADQKPTLGCVRHYAAMWRTSGLLWRQGSLCGGCRDAKTYEWANNVCVKCFLAWVKYEPNFTLFCCKSELCHDFSLFGGIFWHILELYIIFWFFCELFGSFGPFTLFCRNLDLS